MLDGHDEKLPVNGGTSSFWEHETIANYYGKDKFRSASSITQNILKTQVSGTVSGGRQVTVTAHGFRGINRIDYIPKDGNDGKWHDVPVSWVKYLPVSKTSPFIVRGTEGMDWNEFKQKALPSEVETM